jgi:hypothetical protein
MFSVQYLEEVSMAQQVNINNAALMWGDSPEGIPIGVDRSTEAPQCHEAYIGGIRIPFEAQSDEDAVQKGHALIIEKLKEVFGEFIAEKIKESQA